MRKLAAITGAASGLGFDLSKLLAKDGYNLILIDIDGQKLQQSQTLLATEYKIQVSVLEIDLGKPDVADQIFEKIKTNSIDVLINNAGFGLWGPFSETEWVLEKSMLYLQVITPTHLTKLVIKEMIKRGQGRVMNVSSVAALYPGPMMAVYYASKAYLLSFGQAISNELRGTGVSVTTFCPGLIRTNFAQKVSVNSRVPKMEDSLLADKSDKMARMAYKAMLKGKPVYIPTLKNKLIAFLSWLLPRRVIVRMIRATQDSIHK